MRDNRKQHTCVAAWSCGLTGAPLQAKRNRQVPTRNIITTGRWQQQSNRQKHRHTRTPFRRPHLTGRRTHEAPAGAPLHASTLPQQGRLGREATELPQTTFHT
jgi:hypothetical protein